MIRLVILMRASLTTVVMTGDTAKEKLSANRAFKNIIARRLTFDLRNRPLFLGNLLAPLSELHNRRGLVSVNRSVELILGDLGDLDCASLGFGTAPPPKPPAFVISKVYWKQALWWPRFLSASRQAQRCGTP